MWTIPECSYFGVTKAKAEADGVPVLEGTAPYHACLRGRVFAPDGMLKLVFRQVCVSVCRSPLCNPLRPPPVSHTEPASLR